MFNLLTASVFAVLGLIAGFFSLRIAKKQIESRVEKIPELKEFNPSLLEKKWVPCIWIISFACVYVLAVFRCSNIVALIYAAVFIFCVYNIAAVDLAIRRIPNELLLTLLVSSLVKDIAEPIINKSYSDIKSNLIYALIGIVGGFILYIIPSRFGVYIGNGDIKLSAVIGFSLGIVGYVQAMLIMALIMLVYLIILLITKKGGLKTKAPMGPSLAIGAVATLLFPILQGQMNF